MRLERLTWVAASTACALAVGAVTPAGLSRDDDTGAVTAAASPAVTTPRLAFTADRDELVQMVVIRTNDNDDSVKHTPMFYAAYRPNAGRHTGEASASNPEPDSAGRPAIAYVSTESDDPDGEVWVDRAGEAWPVTCDNTAVESHPVPSPNGNQVVYASNADGSFDLWLAEIPTSPTPCADIPRRQLTRGAGDDLWPSWLPGDRGVVFSSTRHDPLGDLYLIRPDEAPLEPWVVQRLTDSPTADTQPAAVPQADGQPPSDRQWLAFTTTRFRRDGSIGMVDIGAALPVGGDDIASFWDLGQPPEAKNARQSAEPAWSPDSGNGSPGYLSFSTTSNDHYGDVQAVVMTTRDDGQPTAGDNVFDVAAEPGRTESHSAWQTGFRTSPPDDTGRDIAEAGVLVTRRSHRAAVADVAAATGAARRPLTGEPPADAAGPAYSPDGTRIAYSGAVQGGRQIVITRSDGTGPTPVDTDRQPEDTDVDPTWSPDGSRLAFTRVRLDAELQPRSAVWTVDLGTGAATEVSRPLGTRAVHDESPSWSPDGRWLVITRHVVPPPPSPSPPSPSPSPSSSPPTPPPPPVINMREAVSTHSSRATPGVAGRALTTLWIVDPATGRAAELTAPDCVVAPTCARSPLRGRSPAWSPDGKRIAFEVDGQLEIADLLPGGVDPGVPTSTMLAAPTVVTGIRPDNSATPSRPLIASAGDPAWARDGSELAFSGQPAGRPDSTGVWAIRPDGTGLRTVADEPGPETEPAYQPYADVAVSLRADPRTVLTQQAVAVGITVVNQGPAPAAEVTLTLRADLTVESVRPVACDSDSGSRVCRLGALAPGAEVRLTAVMRATAAGVQRMTAAAAAQTPDIDVSDNTAVAAVIVAIAPGRPSPQLRALPAVGPPGLVTLAYGERFPPGTEVTLRWARADGTVTGVITSDPGPFRVAADGTLRAPMLIVRGDRLGSRLLVATSTDPGGFDPVSAPMLVIPARLRAPTFLDRG